MIEELGKEIESKIGYISQHEVASHIDSQIKNSGKELKYYYNDPPGDHTQYKVTRNIKKNINISAQVLRKYLLFHLDKKLITADQIKKSIKSSRKIKGKSISDFESLWDEASNTSDFEEEINEIIKEWENKIKKTVKDNEFNKLLLVRPLPGAWLMRNLNQDTNTELINDDENKKITSNLIETFDLLLSVNKKTFISNSEKFEKKLIAKENFNKLISQKIPIYLNKNITNLDWNYNISGSKGFDIALNLTTYIQIFYGKECYLEAEEIDDNYDRKLDMLLTKIDQHLSNKNQIKSINNQK